jgi:MoxR-like ATPase
MPAQDRRKLALNYAQRLADIKELFIGRDEVVDLLGIGALCHEHVLVIGPPGTAKTSLLERFCRTLDTTPFTYLLTRFTEPAEIFGPIDVRRFQDESIYTVNVTGMLPAARVAFLDEVFQGSSAILNTLLTLINERTFHNGRETLHTPLVTLVGSSNDIPDDPVLAAFSDRFLLRRNLGYVADEEMDDLLDLGWDAEREQIRTARANGAGHPPATATNRNEVTISAAELATLQRAVADVDVSPVRTTYVRILHALRAEGITFSDRRAVRAQKVFAASALLAGRMEAEIADLARLVHLWTDPRDEASLRRIITDHGVPVDQPGSRIREVREIQLDLHELAVRRGQVGSAVELRNLMHRIQRLAAELRRDHPGQDEAMRQVREAQRETVTLFRERHPAEGLD